MVFYKLRRNLVAFFIEANTLTIFVTAASYGLVSYVGLLLCGESEVIKPENFFYWLFVTTSTVGYGDISPSTSNGKLFTALFIIPCGLSLFAIVLTKVGLIVSSFIKRGERGLRMVRLKKHCIIIGWNGPRTFKLIKLLLAKENHSSEKIVLVTDKKMENPLTSQIEFVTVESYTDSDTMSRANIEDAARIIIDTQQDDVTLATALFCKQYNPDCHKTVYFEQEDMANLLLPYCPNVEVVPSVSIEMMARSSIDPGSAQLHQQLLDPTVGSSQFSIEYSGEGVIPFKDAFIVMKNNYNVTLVGIRSKGAKDVILNPSIDARISAGDFLYYIAEKRLKNISNLAMDIAHVE